ncbi:hypothetical protein DPQ25_13675 [Hydrogeniiclostridium mannosilyticum]|uniref:PcfJ-like protein n=2 Tax=Hydrogeniiclostridium mannosilyticum TaxID=2764322 RepID=A0A328U8A2_9FIRM|nr:hypothetical protein DPQ25_13675 [Hydrogeniiclostridium mannosilyticum]
MKKSELLTMDRLTATPEMMRHAMNDTPLIIPGYKETREQYKYDLYLRCRVQNDILKVSLFWTANMNKGGNLPIYEVYFSRAEKRFITYDCTYNRWLDSKLDRLEWPQHRYIYYMKVYINRQTRITIRNYLGIENGRLSDLLNYQLKIRQEQLEQRHKRETDRWDSDLAQTPPLPKDWSRWVDKVAIPENYIFYHYKKGGAKTGYCSYCEKEVPIHRPLHNKEGKCPCCRHKITFKSIGRAGFFHTQKVYFYLIQRCKDGVMVREFEGHRTYRKGGYMTPECYVHEIRRMICDKNAIPQRAYYWGLYKQKTFRWINGYINRSGWYTDYSGMVYGKTLPALSKRELKKTGLLEYVRGNKCVDPEEYLIAYEKRPYIEKFVKAGLSRLAKEYVKGRHKYGCDDVPLSIQESSLTKLLGIGGQELKRLRKNNGGSGFLNWLQYEKAYGREIPDHTIAWFCREKITPKDLKFIRGKMSVPQIHNYITRQMSKEHMSSHNVINTWADYLSMAKGLRMNTDNELVYRVRDLRKRHNELVKSCQKYGENIVIQAGRILEEYPHIDEICLSLKEKYEYGNEQYMVIAPTGVEEIILEGRALTHCVSNSDRYWERIENQESYILFLRKSSEPTKPYYTMEIEPDGTIRQKRSILNEQYEDINQAKDFLLEWQKTIAKRLTDEDRSLARQSRMLRLEEFEQLSKDRVTVRTGTLSGKLLVDVLMGDLMENAA